MNTDQSNIKFAKDYLTKKPFNLKNSQLDWVIETLNSLEVKEKVGQLLCLNSSGSKSNIKDLLTYKPGGIFLSMHFKKHQWKAVKMAQEGSRIPLLVAGDFELGGLGGAINASAYNTQMGVGATNDEKFAFKMGNLAAKEGTAMGYNWTYSPVVDVNYNHMNPVTNVRSFSDNPDLVLKMAKAHIKGVQSNNMVATAKHFPGDGLDDRNQHLVSTHNSLSMEKWRESFGKVYKGVIDAGVMSIMIGHIYLESYYRELYPNMPTSELDPKIKPGTQSKELVEKLLREELGFNGLIVSDATGMVGITSQGKRSDIVPNVINSGIDMFLFAHGRKGDFSFMRNAVETGIIPQKRLDEAIIRILGTKASLNLHTKKREGTLIPLKKNLKIIKNPEHKEWARNCVNHSITLSKDTQNLIPINPQYYKKVLLIKGGDQKIATFRFKAYLKKKGFSVMIYKKGMHVTPDNFDLVMYLLCEIGLWLDNTIRLNWRKMGGMKWFAGEIPTIMISLANPYHLYDLPRIKTYINAYSPFLFTQKMVVDKLVGESPFLGKDPIDVYCGIFDTKI
jgi:beta-N-acetylhexosaminidase